MNYKFKNKLITVILCIIVAVIMFFIIKGLFNDNDKKNENGNTVVTDNNIKPDDNETKPPKEPDIGESDKDVNDKEEEKDDTEKEPNEDTKPSDEDTSKPNVDTSKPNVDTPSSDSSTSSNGGASGPDNVTVKPSTPSSGNSSSNWDVTIGSTEVAVPQSAPKSYKEFSLTKDMSAAEARAYLDNFLNSKYSILLNKQNRVASSYAPSDLITPAGCSYPMERVAGNALVELLTAAKQNGVYDLVLYSGYRTVASQKNKFVTRTQKYLNQGYSQAEAEKKAGEYIAPPGASEHHTGLAADVCSSTIVNKYGYLSDEFDTTASYRWMRDNCAKYGFIIRYTKGDEAITGYSYEPWHLRYLGVEHATACTQLGYTYEEYHSMLIALRDSAK